MPLTNLQDKVYLAGQTNLNKAALAVASLSDGQLSMTQVVTFDGSHQSAVTHLFREKF